MTTLWLPAALLMAIAALFVFLTQGKARSGNAPNRPYPVRQRPIMTEPEQVLFYRLCKALPEYLVLAQVAVSRIVDVVPGTPNRFGEFRRFSQWTVDFVICTRDSRPIRVIELDDGSHRDGEREVTDAKKNQLFADARLPLTRYHTSELPTEALIREAILSSQDETHPTVRPALRAAAR